MNTAELIFMVVRYWLIAGAFVAAAFLTFGIDRIDEDARGTYVFRPLLVPGVLLIWPMVLWRWFVLETGRDTPADRYRPVRQAHRGAAIVMVLAIVGVVLLGLSIRQQWPAEIAPEQLSKPPEQNQ